MPIIHEAPYPSGPAVTPCCGRTVFELPKTDRMTTQPHKVTCEPNTQSHEQESRS
jgi:hypothetical protein